MGTPLTSVSGIGPAAAALLAGHGITSVEQLAASVVEDLLKVPGFGPVRAATTLRAARTLVERSAGDARGEDAPAKPGKGGKAKKKGGKGNKGKGKKPRKSKDKKRKKDERKKKKSKGTQEKGGKDKKKARGKRRKK